MMDAGTLKKTPTGAGFQFSTTFLVCRILPAKILNGPALGILHHNSCRLGCKQDPAKRFHEVTLYPAILRKSGHERGTIKGCQPRLVTGKMTYGSVGIANKHLGVFTDDVQVKAGEYSY